jgi:putative nucleotidyltransferase with HDIG domain
MIRRVWDAWRWGAGEAARRRAEPRLRRHAWPAHALAILRMLARDGHQALLVGGSVRDALMPARAGAASGDGAIDIATDRLPDEVLGLFPHTVPTGIPYGTVLIVTPEGSVECTTFRTEGGYRDARHPGQVTFTDDPLADLDRRDLTVNALAFDPAAGSLLDPHDGALDLEQRRLRAVGDPLARFREDALRPFRVARLAAVLDLPPDDALLDALAAIRDPASGVRVEAIAAERIRDELQQLMAAPRPSIGFELLRRGGLLERWLPELASMVGVGQNRFHAHDVWTHTLLTTDAAPVGKPRVRWAALLHDVGKPATKVMRNDDWTFYEHDAVGAGMADQLLERLRFPTDEREAIVHLVREHMFDLGVASDAALRRWLRRVGTANVADLFDLRIADTLGNQKRHGFPSGIERLRERIQRLIDEDAALHVHDLAVDGNDVMHELGVAPGPEVGQVLDALLEEVIDRPGANTREHLLARLRERRMSNA